MNLTLKWRYSYFKCSYVCSNIFLKGLHHRDAIKSLSAAVKFLLVDFICYKASFLSAMYRWNSLHFGFLLFVFVGLGIFFVLCGVLGRWVYVFFNDGGLYIAMSGSEHFCLEEQPMVTAGWSPGKAHWVKMQLAWGQSIKVQYTKCKLHSQYSVFPGYRTKGRE